MVMTTFGVLQILLYFAILLLTTKPIGAFMARVFAGERTLLHPLLRPLERLVYRLCGVKEEAGQRWTQYCGAVLAFSFFSFLFVYLLQRLQGWLPFNPMAFGTAEAPQNATAMTPDLAFMPARRR
jgi:K+-transporting ATPase ATPase A chain